MAATDDASAPRDAATRPAEPTPRAEGARVGDGGVPEAGGVDLQPDVERIHRAIRREPHDPVEGHERPPWFFVAVIALTLFWGGWYLGRYGGEFGLATHIALANRQPGIAGLAVDQSATATADPVEAGQVIYSQHCQSCHQQSGQGVAGVFPPIVGSEWVTGPSETVVRILLHGLQGPIEVAGTTYNGAMPAWKDVLKDEEIAAVATYVRQLGANQAAAVSPGEVAALREATASRSAAWTADELRAAVGTAPTVGGTPSSTPEQAGPTPVGVPAAGPQPDTSRAARPAPAGARRTP